MSVQVQPWCDLQFSVPWHRMSVDATMSSNSGTSDALLVDVFAAMVVSVDKVFFLDLSGATI